MLKIKDKSFNFEGSITLKEILKEIKNECRYRGNYEKERNNMIYIINRYLDMLE